MSMKKYLSALITLFAIAPKLAFADVRIFKPSPALSASAIISSMSNWLLGIAGSVAILFIIYSGFTYITSAGNKERIDAAKKTLTFALLGLLVIIFARVILSIVVNTAGIFI